MLYRPEAFEPLVEEAWNEGRVRAAIAAIVADVDEQFDARGLWPANEWDAWKSTSPLKDLYCGAGGVVLALDLLRRRGLAETRVDLGAAIACTLELWRDAPDLSELDTLPSPRDASLFAGEAGLLLVAWRVSPAAGLADALLEHVRANVDNEAEELMWGAPGTLLAAQAMHEWTGEERWAEARRESAEAVLARRDGDGLWTQRLFGAEPQRHLGPAHGFVGIVHALLRVDADWNDGLRSDAANVLAREAVSEGSLVNWPPLAGDELENARGEIRLQWCHGAPGMVATATPYLDEQLLLGGAELTWRAGAHGAEKGPGPCHGTAGNGHALLKVFARTGDELWLERARRFAIHALHQSETARAEVGRGRYSLFTGDLGVAVFAASCLDADARFPVLEAWD